MDIHYILHYVSVVVVVVVKTVVADDGGALLKYALLISLVQSRAVAFCVLFFDYCTTVYNVE